jgi:predicted RND superfamily exporter protein
LRQSLEARPIRLSDVPDDIRGRYVANDGRLRVRISPRNNVQKEGEMDRFVSAVTAVAPTATDTPVIVLAAADAIIDAIKQAALTALVLISILLLALLRSLRDSLLVFFPLALAGLLTVATAVLLDLPFNFANVIVLPLLMGLGVASGIHLVMRAREEETGVALLGTSTPRAVVFSALTTIGSFGSLAISTHRGTASMGELLTIAIGYTLVCTLVALPALMAWLERR